MRGRVPLSPDRLHFLVFGTEERSTTRLRHHGKYEVSRGFEVRLRSDVDFGKNKSERERDRMKEVRECPKRTFVRELFNERIFRDRTRHKDSLG